MTMASRSGPLTDCLSTSALAHPCEEGTEMADLYATAIPVPV